MSDDRNTNGRRGHELSAEERALWLEAMSLDSKPEDRAAIMDAAREYAALGTRKTGVWRHLRGWSLPPLRPWSLGDLVTGAAIALSIFVAAQFKPWQKTEGPTAGWASSTPAVFYGQTAIHDGRDPAAGQIAEPSPLPRPY